MLHCLSGTVFFCVQSLSIKHTHIFQSIFEISLLRAVLLTVCVHTHVLLLSFFEAVPLVEFMYVPLVKFMYFLFTQMPVENYCRQFRSLSLCLCNVFQVLINSFICWFSIMCIILSKERNIEWFFLWHKAVVVTLLDAVFKRPYSAWWSLILSLTLFTLATVTMTDFEDGSSAQNFFSSILKVSPLSLFVSWQIEVSALWSRSVLQASFWWRVCTDQWREKLHHTAVVPEWGETFFC